MKTHCIRNHELTPENARPRKDGGVVCRVCEAERARRGKASGKWKTELSPEQKARKAERDRNRPRTWTGRTFTPEQRDARNAQKREKRAAAAWEQAYAYYLAWWERFGEHGKDGTDGGSTNSVLPPEGEDQQP